MEMKTEKGCQAGLVEKLLDDIKCLSSAVSTKLGMKFETPPVDQLKASYFAGKKESNDVFRKYKRMIESGSKEDDQPQVK